MSNYVLAIDQGTPSSRAILFDGTHTPVATAQEEFEQHFLNRVGSSTSPRIFGNQP